MLPSAAPKQLMLLPPTKVGEVAVDTSNAGSVRVIDVVVEHPFASVTVTL